jgi:hypothetical protein
MLRFAVSVLESHLAILSKYKLEEIQNTPLLGLKEPELNPEVF